MGNEIANPMPTKYKIFLGKGVLPLTTPTSGPAPGPLRTPRSQTVLPTIQNGMTPMHKRVQGGGWRAAALASFFMTVGGNEPLGGIYNWWNHGISDGNGTNWEFITKLCEFYLRKRGFLDFLNTKTREPRCHNGILDENSTNWQFSAKLHVNFTTILPYKTGFLGLLKC